MSSEPTLNGITRETCYVPATHKGKGRRVSVAPGATATRFLHYGRVTLDAGDEPVAYSNGDHETAFVCLAGEADVSVGAERFRLTRYDALYVPRDSDIEVRAAGDAGCDLAEISAPV